MSRVGGEGVGVDLPHVARCVTPWVTTLARGEAVAQRARAWPARTVDRRRRASDKRMARKVAHSVGVMADVWAREGWPVGEWDESGVMREAAQLTWSLWLEDLLGRCHVHRDQLEVHAYESKVVRSLLWRMHNQERQIRRLIQDCNELDWE